MEALMRIDDEDNDDVVKRKIRAFAHPTKPGPFIVPVGIVAEVDRVLTTRAPGATTHLLGSLIDGSLLMDCGDQDPPRILELLGHFGDLHLGFADAAVIACAERNGGRVLTFDRSTFEVVARDVPISLVPSDA